MTNVTVASATDRLTDKLQVQMLYLSTSIKYIILKARNTSLDIRETYLSLPYARQVEVIMRGFPNDTCRTFLVINKMKEPRSLNC